MGLTVTGFEPTPHSQAMKARLNRPISATIRRYFRAEQAEQAGQDPVARVLFGMADVAVAGCCRAIS